MARKNTVKNDDVKEIEVVNEAVKDEIVKETVDAKVETVDEKEEKKKFQPEDLIPCVSITPGEMFYSGSKSENLYTFADIDDVVEIEFRDLDYAARSKDAMMYKPRFIIQDANFVALHPALDEVYSSLHSTKDLKDILKMTPVQMKKVIASLPEGAKDSIKTIAMTMVDNGTLDSIQRVKAIDEIFGTEMLLKLNSFE